MIFSNATTYAIRAILFLAIHGTKESKTGIKEISEKLEIPYHFLGKIMQQLARNQLIKSLKGPTGGFYMTSLEKSMSMMEVIELFEGKELFNQCSLGLKECSEDKPCPLHAQFKFFKESLQQNLKTQSIGDWAKQVESGNVVLWV